MKTAFDSDPRLASEFDLNHVPGLTHGLDQKSEPGHRHPSSSWCYLSRLPHQSFRFIFYVILFPSTGLECLHRHRRRNACGVSDLHHEWAGFGSVTAQPGKALGRTSPAGFSSHSGSAIKHLVRSSGSYAGRATAMTGFLAAVAVHRHRWGIGSLLGDDATGS